MRLRAQVMVSMARFFGRATPGRQPSWLAKTFTPLRSIPEAVRLDAASDAQPDSCLFG
ncbi:hypothetical protein THICB1_100338 [Thiomonas arsenitoxydans]|uniref:Transposase n=1 Tax=Thiomonas arsenitoxydans (strain DSM 22701 / CIP 110005 / 3As) TaxID=426114 RepID=A0ABP1Z0Z2_THIA3|nr:hypothetical protein THICB1_100338 [Thiomonas arsenitoxydans]